MPSQASVVVIGGGAVGLSAALHLARLGARAVTVLERAQVASGSSGLSVGIVETQYLEPLDIELRVRSMEAFGALEREEGLEIVRNGYLRLAHSEAELAAFERSVEAQRAFGVDDARVLGRAVLERLVPDMRCGDLAGGLFGPSDGYLDGHLYCSLLGRMAEALGARVLTGAELLGEGPGSSARHRLSTARGELECDYVVNAAGAWAAVVGRLLGTSVPLVPQRHQAAVAHLPRALGYVMPSVMDYTPGSGGFGLYFRHEGQDKLVTGLHTEEPLHGVVDPDRFDRGVDTAFLEAVAAKLHARLPGLGDARLAHGWAGLYPVSPDGRPQVGPSRERETVIAACGGGGSGLQTSPALGRLAAEWVLFGEPRSVPAASALAPGRSSLDGAVSSA